MKYLCVHCDHRFESDSEKKPRCPKCMRVGGVETVKGESSPKSERPAWLVPGAVALGLAAIVGGYFVWARETPDTVGEDVSLAPLSRSELAGHVRRVGADVGDAELALFDVDDALEEMASSAVSGESSNVDKANAVVEAIRRRASKRGFVPWSLGTPRDTPIRGAARAWETMSEDNAQAHLYPLEVALAAAAALRAEGVDAMLAEIHAFPGDRSPPDPSGHFGYFGLAIYADEPGEGTPTIVDPYGGRGTEPEEDDYRVIDDVAVLGAYMNHLAIHLLVNEGDAAQAFERSEAALKLDRRSPSIRSVRGAVLLVSGGTEEGKAEFEAAAQLRRDAPRLNNLAGIALASQDLELAQRNVAAALELHPDFAGGHATQGAVHLAQREPELAERELRTAEELDHDLPILPMLWANYYMGTGDLEQAAEKALQAVERRPHDWNTRLSAAQVLRAAGRFEDMRRQAHAVVEMVPDAQRDAIRALMLRPDVLGPTALEELEDEEGFEDEEGDLGDFAGDGFRLESQTGLLDEDEGGGLPSGMGGPSLLGEEGPLLNPGDPSRLRLGGEGEGLRLDLSGE